MFCLTSVLSQGWIPTAVPSLIFVFIFILLFLCCAICHFSWKKPTSHHYYSRLSRPYIYRGDVRRYGYGCLATAKTSPPSFSLRCKLIGLCWLLWRYCLWWLPLAIYLFIDLFIFCILGRCLDSPCSTAWRVTVATMNCVWCVVSFLLLFCPGFLILANTDQWLSLYLSICK